MKTNVPKASRGFTLVELLVVIVIIAALAGLTAPMVIRQRKKADQTEAVNNARQIGMALFEFESEYGTFPDNTTAATVATNTETTAVSGNTANDRFRQLIRSGIAQSEAMFYSKTSYTKKPDGIFDTDTKALSAGEVGYGLMEKADGTGLSAAGNPARPVVMTPFDQSLASEKFDFDMYDGKAVILKLDNSAASYPIIKTSQLVKVSGKGLLDTGADTVWGTNVTPKVAYPQAKGN
jgi:prepilin-type N-terminal cleavage/methylation domain-containing protein